MLLGSVVVRNITLQLHVQIGGSQQLFHEILSHYVRCMQKVRLDHDLSTRIFNLLIRSDLESDSKVSQTDLWPDPEVLKSDLTCDDILGKKK